MNTLNFNGNLYGNYKFHIDAMTPLAAFILYYFNSCTAEFIKGTPVTTLFAISFFLLWIVLAMLMDKSFITRFLKITWPLIVCTIVLTFFYTIGMTSAVGTLRTNLINSIYILVITALFIYYYCDHRTRQSLFLLKFWFADTLITCVYSIIRLQEDPLISRYLSTGSILGLLETNVETRGIITFATVYGLVLIIAILTHSVLSKSKYNRFVSVVFIVIFSTALIYAQFTISLLLTVVGVAFVWIAEKNKSRYKKLWLIVIPIIVMMIAVFIPTILRGIVDLNVFPYEINVRLEEIVLFCSGEGSKGMDIGLRLLAYTRSLHTFFANGCMGKVLFNQGFVGLHSEILDMLANYGVVFFGLYCAFFKNVYNLVSIKLTYDGRTLLKVVYILFILSSILNTSLWAPTMIILIIVVPLLLKAST